MSSGDTQFKLRLPNDLKSRLEVVARSANRSLTAEIVQRLIESFRERAPVVEKADATVKRLLAELDEAHETFRAVSAGIEERYRDEHEHRKAVERELEALRASVEALAQQSHAPQRSTRAPTRQPPKRR